MTMNVSKGEFDRRVKLLEQQVRTTTNDLINRLQAESEYYIEQLKNTNLNIDELKKEIEEGGGIPAEISRKLDDLISSYNNFKANTLRINDVFDADGQFDGSKIRPLSIETAALSVGQRSQQLALNGVQFTVNDYVESNNNHGNVLWTKGLMFHYGYGTNTDPKIYLINNGNQNIANANGQYIYAKLSKAEVTSTDLKEPQKTSQEYFNGYFEKLYEVQDSENKLSSVTWEQGTTTDENNHSKNYSQLKTNSNYRIRTVSNINLESNTSYIINCDKFYYGIVKLKNGYGYGWEGWKQGTYIFNTGLEFDSIAVLVCQDTTASNNKINPNQIEHISIKLYKGKKVYNGSIPEFVNTSNYYYEKLNETTYNNINITSDTFRKNMLDLYYKSGDVYNQVFPSSNIPSYNKNYFYCTKEELTENLPAENGGSVSIEGNTTNYNNEASIYVTNEKIKFDGSNAPSGEQNYLYILLGYISSPLTGSNGYNYRKVDMTYGMTTINGRLITTGRIEGGTQNSAYFDLDTGEIGGNINFTSDNKASLKSVLDSVYDGIGAAATAEANANSYTNTGLNGKEDGGWLSKSKVLYYRNTSQTTPSIPTYNSSNQSIVYTKNGITWTDNINSLAPSSTNTTNFYIYKCEISYKEKNNKIKDFSCTNAIYDQSTTTNLIAMQGSTTIAGGLILSSKIIVKDNNNANNCAVLNGTDQYAFYAGDQSATSAPVHIKRDGSAKFGDLNIANNGMLSFSNSSFYLKKVDFEINKTLQESLFNLNNTTPGTTIYLIQEETGKQEYTFNMPPHLFIDVEHTDNWVNFKTQVNVTQYKNGYIDNIGVTLTVEVEQFGAGTDDKRTSKVSLTNSSQFTSSMSVNNKLFIKANTAYTFTIKVERGSGNVNSLKINNGAVTIVNRDYVDENFIEKGFNIYGNGWSMYKDSAAIICFINEGNIIFKKAILNRNKNSGFSVSESTII